MATGIEQSLDDLYTLKEQIMSLNAQQMAVLMRRLVINTKGNR